jgi:hypothetical protein
MELDMKERERKLNANCQSRSPMPSTSAEPPPGQEGMRGRQGQATLVGAGKTGGGRGGRLGQARPMGAVSRRAKSLVNTPPLAQGFPDK